MLLEFYYFLKWKEILLIQSKFKNENCLKIENLYKEYQLGVFGTGTLYRDLQSLYSKFRGKEDPNSIIGSNKKNLKNKFLAIENINLTMKKGEILGIIGPNGAGKSTLLKIISRITSPTRGLIKYSGRLSSLLEVGTGFHQELTGRENIYLNGAINGLNKKQINDRIDAIIEFSGVGVHIDTPVKRYSSGMFVKLGFSVAAFLDPDILIVDEVLAVGDASFQKKALGKMEEVSKTKNRSIIFVSHNMASISSLCSRVILINDGKIIEDGEPSYVINRYLNFSLQERPLISKDQVNKLKVEKIYRGSKSFDINEIKIFDQKDSLKLNFNSEDEINISINFKIFKEILDFRLILYINSTSGENLLSSIHLDDEKMLEYKNIKEDNYTFTCKIPNNIFGKNSYLLSLHLLDHSNHHLLLDNIFKISVNFNGFNDVNFLINPQSPFKLKFKWESSDY